MEPPPPSSSCPLLCGEVRKATYPIEDLELWQHYKRQQASNWVAEEIDFKDDREQWNTLLNDDERHFLRCVLAFFAHSDGVVALNIMRNFCGEVRSLEALYTYGVQVAIENVHAEVYSIMIDKFITDPVERADMFDRMGSHPSVIAKIEWAKRWALDADDVPFIRRLLAFIVVEGIFFSGCFCAIYWIKQRNLLPGLTKSNEFIARDEGQHTEFGCTLYNRFPPPERLAQEEVHAFFGEAMAIERAFIVESVPCRLVGINSDLMSEYLEHVCDGVMARIGYDPMYGTPNPFPWMENLTMNQKSNFFEERVSVYQRADLLSVAVAEDGASAAHNPLFDTDF